MEDAELERRYFEDVESYPVLSEGQIADLRVVVRDGDSEAAEVAATDLVCSHLRLVVDIARQLDAAGPVLDVDGEAMTVIDLSFAGTLGLMQAVRDDDLSEPFKQRAERFVRNAIAEGTTPSA